jgi:hypothetical protein
MTCRSEFIRDRELYDALAASNHRAASKLANIMTQQGMHLLVGIGADLDQMTLTRVSGDVHVASSDFLLLTNGQLEHLLLHSAAIIRDEYVVVQLGECDLDRQPPEENQEAHDGR